MAKLGPCRACGQQVSKKAQACPHCGERDPARPKQYGCGSLLLLVIIAGVVWAVLPTEIDSPSLAASCEPVSDELVAAIAGGLTVQGGGSIVRAVAVRSGSHENAWYVAAQIEGPGLEGTIGVWATNRLDATGTLFSVDNIANEFSSWGDGRTTDAAFSSSDPSAAAARRCMQ
jgi:hypothetical protein